MRIDSLPHRATNHTRKSPSREAASSNAPEEKKDWTVLGFFNGNNDLETTVVSGVIAADEVGPNSRLNFVTQLARAPQEMVHPKKGERHDNLDGDWTGVRRYETRFSNRPVDKHKIGAKLVAKMPEYTDMGSPDALADFLRWGIKNYPAKHYMIVINDHGTGFRGVSHDDVHDSSLSPQEIRQVLEQIKKESGVKPDVLLFDACEMAQTEVAYELRNNAKFLVGGEDLIGAAGVPYANILTHAAFTDDLTPRALSAAIVDETAQDQIERVERGDEEACGQFSAIDLSKLEDLRHACDRLSSALRNGGLARAKLASTVKRTKRFGPRHKPERDYRDLGDFAHNLVHGRHVKDERVKNAAQHVLDVLAEAVVAHQAEGDGMARSHGLSIYLPADGGRDPDHPRERDPFGYRDLAMSKDGRWPQLLEHIHPRRISEKKAG